MFQVGKLNPKDNSYALKDEFYRHVQRDWPGYLEEEKQFVHRLLIRWVLSVIQKNLQLVQPEKLHIRDTVVFKLNGG